MNGDTDDSIEESGDSGDSMNSDSDDSVEELGDSGDSVEVEDNSVEELMIEDKEASRQLHRCWQMP